jgi:hypothetical protein
VAAGTSADQAVNTTPEEQRENPVLDEMWRLGIQKRDSILGTDYFSRLRDFWNMRQGVASTSRTPTFRPTIMFSDLHWMSIQEAGDLTDNSPIPIITGGDNQRRAPDEKALRGQWYIGEYGMSFYHASLEALLAGTGVLMMVYDAYARRGRGSVCLKWIDTENFVVDPSCTSFRNWQYVVYRARLSLDEIRRSFPGPARRLPRFPTAASIGVPKIGAAQGESPDQLKMPPGPMQQMALGPLGAGTDTRVAEWFLILDDGRKQVRDIGGSKETALLPEPQTMPAYPYGRLIIRCDKIKLFDGPNPYRRFPFIPVQVHPARQNFWAPPPIRYVIQLQEIAQTLSRQTIENAVRLNNGLVVINEAAGLAADKILGLPGERVVVNSPEGVDRAIKILTPPPFSAESLSMPDKLLDKMRSNFGQSDQRAGKLPAGNVSSNLYDSSLSQATGLTQVRARLMQPSVKLALEMVYETMLQYQNPTMFPYPSAEKDQALEFIKWSGARDPDEIDNWELLVDPSSIKAMSSAMARQYALLLRNAGLLDVLSTLEAIGWPDAENVAKKVQDEQSMQLLSKESSRGAPRRR